MKGKRLTTLLVLLAACAVAAVVLVLVVRRNKKTSDAEIESYYAAESEFESKSADVITLNDFLPDDVVTITYNGPEHEEMTFSRESGVWVYEEDPEFPLNAEEMDRFAKELATITATRKIDVAASDAGLSDPEMYANYTLRDGTEGYVHLGSMNATKESYYAQVSGDDNIYLVDFAWKYVYEHGLYDLLLQETVPDFTEILPEVLEMRNGSAVKCWTQITEGDDRGDYLLDDGESENSAILMQQMMGVISSIKFTDCVNYRADEASLSTYGFSNPAAEFRVQYASADRKEAEFDLLVGGPAETTGTRYAKLADSNMVYTISESTYSEMLNAMVPDSEAE